MGTKHQIRLQQPPALGIPDRDQESRAETARGESPLGIHDDDADLMMRTKVTEILDPLQGFHNRIFQRPTSPESLHGDHAR